MKKEAINLLMQHSNDSKHNLEEEANGDNAILCPAIIDAIIPQPT